MIGGKSDLPASVLIANRNYNAGSFNNFICPNQQLTCGFAPDRHTAKICLQVVKAAIASLAGQRTP
jgi:hypothetical protein